jgi:hypothetical protein
MKSNKDKETKKRTLIICGEGGLEQRWQRQSLNIWEILFHRQPGYCENASVYWSRGFADDVTVTALHRFHSGRVDEVKSFLDINSERAVKCRHEDGYIWQSRGAHGLELEYSGKVLQEESRT